jgi:uncharacterized RDD family membrane protein YckC/cytoskeletal protein CcmA (bactofilin family)
MKTNILKQIRWWTPVLCCVLLSAARAQDIETPAAGKDATVQVQAPDRAQATDRAASDAQPPSDTPPRSDTPSPSDEDEGDSDTDTDTDKSTAQPDTEEGPTSHRHRHRHGGESAVVSIGHAAELLAGEHAESVVAVLGSATSAGEVDNSVVSVLGNTHVTGKVGDGAVAVLGNVYVNGEVDGDVVAVLGNVELGPAAKVRGNVVIVGGNLTRDPTATIGGHVQTVLSTDWVGFDWLRPWIERCLLYGRPLAFAHGLGWAWGIALGLLALYAFIALAFRGAVESCVETLESKPGHSLLTALFAMLLTPVLLVLLLITVLGIAAIPFVGIGLLCAAMLGKVVVLASIGRRCTPMLAKDPVAHTVLGVVVGGAIVLVLYTIPVIGFIVQKLIGIMGLGAVIYTVLTAVRSGRQARAAARNGGVGPNGGAGPGGGMGPAGGAGFAAGSTGRAEGPTESSDAAGAASLWAGRPMGSGPAGASAQTSDMGGTATNAPAGASSDVAGRGEPHMSTEFGDFTARPEPPAGGSASPDPSNPHTTSGFTSSTPPPGSVPPGSVPPGSVPPGSVPPGSIPPGSAAQPTAPVASLPRAGFFIRMGALLLDAVLIGIVLHQFWGGPRLELLALAAYGAVMWKLRGSTIGGIICGLQVLRLDGRPIDWPTAIVRALSCFLSLAVVGLGFLWIAIDSERQSWHDKIAGTVVVRAPKGASLL